MGIRQWWALTALAAADPVPLTVSMVRKAVRARRHGDPAKDVTDSLLNKGLIEYASLHTAPADYATSQVRLTNAGWSARLNQAGRVEARAKA